MKQFQKSLEPLNPLIIKSVLICVYQCLKLYEREIKKIYILLALTFLESKLNLLYNYKSIIIFLFDTCKY